MSCHCHKVLARHTVDQGICVWVTKKETITNTSVWKNILLCQNDIDQQSNALSYISSNPCGDIPFSAVAYESLV